MYLYLYFPPRTLVDLSPFLPFRLMPVACLAHITSTPISNLPTRLFRVCSLFPAVLFHPEGTGLILRSRHPCWRPQTSHAQSGTPPPKMLPKLSKYWIYHRREHIWLINSLSPNWSHSDKDLKCTPIVSGYCFQLHMLLPATMQSVHFMLVCKSCSHQTIDSQYLN